MASPTLLRQAVSAQMLTMSSRSSNATLCCNWVLAVSKHRRDVGKHARGKLCVQRLHDECCKLHNARQDLPMRRHQEASVSHVRSASQGQLDGA